MSKASGFSETQIRRLMQPGKFGHPVENIRLVETHISWVILTGSFAYKIKKPVDLGFLDFSTLEKRRFYCDEEIRLNRRLAADYYLGVVSIRGSMEDPSWEGEGDVIEYAVKMRQFPQDAQLDRLLARGKVDPSCMDAFARLVADFHEKIAVAGSSLDQGSPGHVYHPVAENLSVLMNLTEEQVRLTQLEILKRWCRESFDSLQTLLVQRKEQGFIRECHGDMHLRNMAWIDGEPLIFDCIEFNSELRWIDVTSEIAFLVMDLLHNRKSALAWRFLNTYLECRGDYAGLRLLPFYLTYRAMVRAKIAAIRASQPHISQDEKRSTEAEISKYLRLAEQCSHHQKPLLIITRGMSASGKSTWSSRLLEALGAIRIRSDVERKRLFGIAAKGSGRASYQEGIYSQAASKQTYARLLQLAVPVLEAGYPVIIDAAFLQTAQRRPFQQLAGEMGLPYIILEFSASPAALRDRIQRRADDVSDADLSVLEQQLRSWEGLEPDEASRAIVIDTENAPAIETLLEKIQAKAELPDR